MKCKYLWSSVPTILHLPYINVNSPRHIVNVDVFLFEIPNRISGEMRSVLTSKAVDRGFEHRSGPAKYHTIDFCCFSTEIVALRRKSKDSLPRDQDNVSECDAMSIRGLF